MGVRYLRLVQTSPRGALLPSNPPGKGQTPKGLPFPHHMEVPPPGPFPAASSGAPTDDPWVLGLREALQSAVLAAAAPGPVCLLFSGGLDSSLLAHLLARARVPVELLVVGLPGSFDLASARDGARALGLPLSSETLTAAEVEACADWLQGIPGAPRGSLLAVQTALALAFRRAHGDPVLCGQGADELFLGYTHYKGLTGEALERRAEEDLLRLREVDLPFSRRVAERSGKTLSTPYLSEEVIQALAPVPWEARRGPGEPKALLRKVALSLGLPPSLAGKPKKALQYGSGVDRVLRKGHTPLAPPRGEGRTAAVPAPERG